MNRPFRLNSELAAINVMIPKLDLLDLTRARSIETELALSGRQPTAGVESHDITITGLDGNSLAVRIYVPTHLGGALPVLLYVHGGAFMLGGLHTEDERCELYAAKAFCIVIQVDYRLAPEHPFPAAFNDVLSTLSWMAANSDRIGIDPRRIAIGGNSAGGGIAAAVALESRESSWPDIVLQLLINPALDCRRQTASANDFQETPVFTSRDNEVMWRAYLGSPAYSSDYRASPSLANSVVGSPPAVIWLAEFDPLRDEGYEYALRLMHAGTSVGIHQYSGTFHGFDSYRMTRLGRRAIEDQIAALRSAFS